MNSISFNVTLSIEGQGKQELLPDTDPETRCGFHKQQAENLFQDKFDGQWK